MQSRYRVIIIDEVHQISKSAFNALLKTLEEPPEKTVFIFATTEFQKVPATIVSRCQHFEFKRVSQKDLIYHLMEIARTGEFDGHPLRLRPDRPVGRRQHPRQPEPSRSGRGLLRSDHR